jgi:hypothetical protein
MNAYMLFGVAKVGLLTVTVMTVFSSQSHNTTFQFLHSVLS